MVRRGVSGVITAKTMKKYHFQRKEHKSEYTLRLLEQLLEIGVLPSKCDTFVVKDLSLLAALLLNGRLALSYCQVLFKN